MINELELLFVITWSEGGLMSNSSNISNSIKLLTLFQGKLTKKEQKLQQS